MAHYSLAKLFYIKRDPAKALSHFGPLLVNPNPTPATLYLLAACTTPDHPLWLVALGVLGEEEALRIRQIAKDRASLLKVLEREEQSLIPWNPIWDGTGRTPVNRLALRGIVGKD